MKPAQLKIFQALAELAIPLAGYFFWNWGFYFILLFYLLDYLIYCVFSFIKERKVQTYQGLEANLPVREILLTVLVAAISFSVLFPALYLVNPGFQFVKETWDFLAYEEMGIPQGMVLVPLLVYSSYAQYKMQFLATGQFQVTSVEQIRKAHFRSILLVLAAVGIFYSISFWLVFPSAVYIFLLIFGVSAYRFFVPDVQIS